LVMGGSDHHSPILVSRGEVFTDAVEAQPYLCYGHGSQASLHIETYGTLRSSLIPSGVSIYCVG